MDHRAASIQFLKSTGLPPVRVRPRQKEAYPDWDPRLVERQDHRAVIAHLSNGSDDNIGALVAGRYIDIDIDDSALLPALDRFLPHTQFMWGRKSKPRSHRVYMLHKEFDRSEFGPLLRYLKSEHEVEIRGGQAANGLYSVLPGSIHPEGEKYEWESEIDPSVSVTVVPLHILTRAIRLAIATANIAHYWQPGSRNDLALAVSGLLWRIRESSLVALGHEDEADVPDDKFLLTKTAALAVFEAVMDLAGDDSQDKRSRLLTFANTWKKLSLDPTAKVTGGKVLATLVGDAGTQLVRNLYRLLSDSPDIEQMERLAEQFVMWYGPGIVIDLDMVEKGRETPWMTKDQTLNSLAGVHVTVGTKIVPAARLLFSSQMIRRVAGLTFDPSTTMQMVDTPEGAKINQWRGFAVEPSTQMVLDSEIQPFLDYVMEVLADGNTERYEWVLSWFADLLQRPHEKPGTALVLVGVQGAGKSFIGEKIIGAIIGKGHSAQTNSVKVLTEKFNTIIDNKIFLQCDEAVHSYQKDAASKLKSVITDTTITIEPKGVNSFRKPNHLHLLFTSNEDLTAIFIDASPFERRFTVLQVSEKRARDIDYWVMMHQWVALNLSKLMRWLLDLGYDKDVIRRPLMTEAKLNLQKMGLDPEIAWILNRIQSGFLLGDRAHTHWFDAVPSEELPLNTRENDTKLRTAWPTLANISAVELDFKEFVRGHGRSLYSGSVLTSLQRVFPRGSFVPAKKAFISYVDSRTQQITKGMVQWYTVPSIESIKAHLRAKYGDIIDAEPEVKAVEVVDDVPVYTEPKKEGDF